MKEEIEVSKYPNLKWKLEDERDVWFSDDEIEDIISIAVDIDNHQQNVGHHKYLQRLKHPASSLERAFHEMWLKENEPRPGINYGRGILQDLFIDGNSANPLGGRTYIEKINNRDRMIVATVIQWLGTNVGMGFLHEVLAKDGKYIASKSTH